MSRVYGWMTGGLCLTGAVAWNVAGNPALVETIFGNRLLFWGLIIAQLGAVAALSGLINRISGLTAWDTQKIKEMYSANDDGTVAGRKAVMGALTLYLDFINLFLFMLRFLGNRR